MDNRDLWTLMGEVSRTITPTYEPVFVRFCRENGLDPWTFGLLLAAYTFEPESITPAKLQVRGPYTAVSSYLERLLRAAEKGLLVETGPGEFHLTPRGRKEIEHVLAEGRSAMAAADPLPLAAGRELADLLDRLVQASLATPPPPDTWSIGLSLKLMPATEPPLPYVEQALSCLAGYRDDAHLAAWQPSGLSAAALEALTLIWRQEASSLEEVGQRLSFRGHALSIYAAALAELRQRGFLAGPDAGLHLTENGRLFRERVERETNDYFFAPWGCLAFAEREQLARLLARLRDGLQAAG